MERADQLVRIDEVDGVTEVVLDRPDKMNAMDAEMAGQLGRAVAGLHESGARAVLVRAEGRAFSAGRDIAGAQPGIEDGGEVLETLFNPIMRDLARLGIPTFAAVQGACLGTGLGVALACDVIYVADDAKLGSPFARIGAVLDSGAHHSFVNRIGAHRTLELIYSGRLLSGREAAEWGLVNRSFPGSELLEATRDLARHVAAGPTLAFRQSKQIVRGILDDGLSLDDVLAAEAEAQRQVSRTHDYVEGFMAFLERRTPTFHGR